MKKISIITLTFLLTIITSVFMIATPAYALENTSRWTENNGYQNYIWFSGSYDITEVNYDDYEFYYYKTGDGWKQLAPTNDDVIKLTQASGETFITRSIYLNDELVVSGTQGMYGDNQIIIDFRYKEIVQETGPEEPGAVWTTKEDGYTYFTGSFAQNQDTNLLIDNIQYNIIEYAVANETVDDSSANWKLINIDNNNRLVVRNIAQGYSSRNVLLVIAGSIEKQIAQATKALLSDGTVISDQLRIRYKQIEMSDTTSVEMLPETRTSIFDNNMNMGTVRFIRTGLNLIVAINYDGLTYYLSYTFDANQDMSIFNNSFEIYYYTHENEKFILINQGDESMFTSSDVKKQTFIPYTAWNLTTNEFEKIERFNTYIYTQKETGNNVYAYFYVDDFIIDELLSVSLGFKYRYNNTFGGYGDWVEEYQLLEAGETNEVSMVTWQGKVLSTTALATSIGAFIPAVRWPVLAVGTAVMAVVGTQTDTNPFSIRNVDQIQVADVDSNLKQKITEAYMKYNKDFTLEPNLKTFKLHLGQYDKAFTKGIEIDDTYSIMDEQKGVNIIQFTYRTDGRVYSIAGDNINVVFEAGKGTDGSKNDNRDIIVPILFFAGIALYIYALIKNNGLKSLKTFVEVTIVFAIVLAIVFAAYFYLLPVLTNNIGFYLRL